MLSIQQISQSPDIAQQKLQRRFQHQATPNVPHGTQISDLENEYDLNFNSAAETDNSKRIRDLFRSLSNIAQKRVSSSCLISSKNRLNLTGQGFKNEANMAFNNIYTDTEVKNDKKSSIEDQFFGEIREAIKPPKNTQTARRRKKRRRKTKSEANTHNKTANLKILVKNVYGENMGSRASVTPPAANSTTRTSIYAYNRWNQDPVEKENLENYYSSSYIDFGVDQVFGQKNNYFDTKDAYEDRFLHADSLWKKKSGRKRLEVLKESKTQNSPLEPLNAFKFSKLDKSWYNQSNRHLDDHLSDDSEPENLINGLDPDFQSSFTQRRYTRAQQERVLTEVPDSSFNPRFIDWEELQRSKKSKNFKNLFRDLKRLNTSKRPKKRNNESIQGHGGSKTHKSKAFEGFMRRKRRYENRMKICSSALFGGRKRKQGGANSSPRTKGGTNTSSKQNSGLEAIKNNFRTLFGNLKKKAKNRVQSSKKQVLLKGRYTSNRKTPSRKLKNGQNGVNAKNYKNRFSGRVGLHSDPNCSLFNRSYSPPANTSKLGSRGIIRIDFDKKNQNLGFLGKTSPRAPIDRKTELSGEQTPQKDPQSMTYGKIMTEFNQTSRIKMTFGKLLKRQRELSRHLKRTQEGTRTKGNLAQIVHNSPQLAKTYKFPKKGKKLQKLKKRSKISLEVHKTSTRHKINNGSIDLGCCPTQHSTQGTSAAQTRSGTAKHKWTSAELFSVFQQSKPATANHGTLQDSSCIPSIDPAMLLQRRGRAFSNAATSCLREAKKSPQLARNKKKKKAESINLSLHHRKGGNQPGRSSGKKMNISISKQFLNTVTEFKMLKKKYNHAKALKKKGKRRKKGCTNFMDSYHSVVFYGNQDSGEGEDDPGEGYFGVGEVKERPGRDGNTDLGKNEFLRFQSFEKYFEAEKRKAGVDLEVEECVEEPGDGVTSHKQANDLLDHIHKEIARRKVSYAEREDFLNRMKLGDLDF